MHVNPLRSAGSQTPRVRMLVLLLVAAVLLAAATSDAQFRRGRFRYQARMASPESFDGAFNFCRAAFSGGRFGDGGGWGVDYPRADINFSIRLSELTSTPISRDPMGDPNHLLLRLTDPELFQCPFVMMTEVGRVFFEAEEAAQLREYLLKGGFLWVDDFWGSYAWEAWAGEIEKVLPSKEYPTVDLPMSHPMFHSQFDVKQIPQIPSINFWVGSGGGTSERGPDSAEPRARAITDPQGHVMVLITHNTDLGDSWEREGDNKDYFYRFSVDGYALGINVMLYAMTH